VDEHRPNYGSIKITWSGASPQTKPVRVSMSCVCGVFRVAEGADFSDAYRKLQEALAKHALQARFQG